MCKNNVLLFWPNFLPEVLDILFRYIMDSIKYQNKKSKPDSLWKKSYNGQCLDLPTGHWFKNKHQNPNKNGSLSTKPGICNGRPSLWPEPRKWVGWTEEKQHQHGSGNLNDLERFCIEEWFLISCQVFSKLIRLYRRKLVICSQCVLEKNIYFTMWLISLVFLTLQTSL